MVQPEFFDIFGFGAFGFITATAFWALWTKRPLPQWAVRILLVIGAFGLIIDGTIVYLTYLR